MIDNVKNVPDVVGDERRISGQLLLYWNSIRKDRLFPKLEDVHPTELGALWDDVFLIDILGEGRFVNFVRSYVGSNVRGLLTAEQTLIDPLLETHFHEVMKQRKPVFSFDELGNPPILLYRMVLLPLSADDNRIDGILGGIRFKAA